jgi:hypothetical protein
VKLNRPFFLSRIRTSSSFVFLRQAGTNVSSELTCPGRFGVLGNDALIDFGVSLTSSWLQLIMLFTEYDELRFIASTLFFSSIELPGQALSHSGRAAETTERSTIFPDTDPTFFSGENTWDHMQNEVASSIASLILSRIRSIAGYKTESLDIKNRILAVYNDQIINYNRMKAKLGRVTLIFLLVLYRHAINQIAPWACPGSAPGSRAGP